MISVAVKKFRLNLCLTQVSFAKKLGVTSTIISHWENGIRNPSLENVRRMSEIAESHGLKFNKMDFIDKDRYNDDDNDT